MAASKQNKTQQEQPQQEQPREPELEQEETQPVTEATEVDRPVGTVFPVARVGDDELRTRPHEPVPGQVAGETLEEAQARGVILTEAEQREVDEWRGNSSSASQENEQNSSEKHRS